jgi:hypothetical protein
MKKITFLITMMFFIHHTYSQDTCDSALPITTAGLFVVDVVNGSQVPTPLCAANGSGANSGEWYAYTPTQDYTVTVSSSISQNTPSVDTRFHVYTGTCSSLTCYAGDDDAGTGYSSTDTFNVAAGTTYYIAWDNRWTSNGFTFQLTENEIIVPPTTPITYTTQSIPTINSAYNICVADMNNDKLDDIVGVSQGNLKIHYQRDNGSFNIVEFPVTGGTSKMPTWSLAAGDYNRDGYNDLILGAGNGLSVWKSNLLPGSLTYTSFNPTDYIFCQRTNFSDINNDGNLDIFSCHDIAPNCYYLNDGSDNLTFYQATVTPGAMNVGNSGGNYATLFFDYDNDNDSDIFISKCSGPPCELIRNDGNDVYTDISAVAGLNITPIQTWSSAIADFDNDGDMDIIITASAGNHHFFKNNLDTSNSVEETFSEITSGSGWDTNASTNIDNIAYDFDNDGFVDVLGGGNKIMFNQGDNTFFPQTYSGISVGAVGDLNNDGYLDILNGNTIRYAVPNGNNWLKVKLNGVESNSNGIGARIEIYGAWGKQIRDVRSGEGFKYMSSIFAHFGIGTATEITKILVKWPSGVVDEILNPGINQMLTITENQTNLATVAPASSFFNITPNPVNDVINITFKNSTSEIASAQIVDLVGKVVLKPTVTTNTIDVKSLANGTYILVLKDKDGKQTSEKFLKN